MQPASWLRFRLGTSSDFIGCAVCRGGEVWKPTPGFPAVAIWKAVMSLESSSLFSREYCAHQSTKPQAPSSTEAPNLKLQTKARAMWWPSRAAPRGLGLGTCLELGAWDLKLLRRVIPPKTAGKRKISRLLIVIHDRYRVSKCLDNRQSSSYFKANLLGPFVRRASGCARSPGSGGLRLSPVPIHCRF